ncbi:LPXTG cell wall anchor domain-containing protein [Saccharopolyspora cebuensis]|uniref:LPXTG cell wall anchor domain-containing protein n=1 Tax=Saccharopolyspora cebuensis TaxID=418759 RepID=UPI0031E5A8DA
MVLSRSQVLGAGAAGAALVAAVLTAPWNAVAQQGTVAESSLLQVTIPGIPGLDVPSYGGTLGDVSSGPGTNVVTWDQSDPDGVLDYVSGWYGTPAPPGTSTVLVNDDVGSREAEAAGNGFGVGLVPGAPNLISFGSVHTYARCTQAPLAPSAEAYARTDENAIYLFDDVTRPLTEGDNQVSVTGDQLGIPGVATGDLTINVQHVEETWDYGARAAIVIEISGVLRDENGDVLHEGPLMSLTAGEVQVDCTDEDPPPTPTPEPPPTTTTEPTDPPTTTPTDPTEPTDPPTTTPTDPTEPTDPPTTTPTDPTEPTDPPTTTPTDPTEPPTTGTEPPSTSEPPGGLPGDDDPTRPGDPDQLAQTGTSVAPLLGLAAALLLLGPLVLLAVRRRS